MNLAERFWWLLTIFAVGWYLTVTVYVAIRGAIDIRQMLARLESQQANEHAYQLGKQTQRKHGSSPFVSRTIRYLGAAVMNVLAILALAALAQEPRPANGLPAPVKAELDLFLKEAVVNGSVPAVVAMAAGPDGIVYEAAFGVQDKAAGIKVGMSSLFRIASMTKPITTVGVLKLIEDGALELDTPLHEVLEEFADRKVIDGFDAATQSYNVRPAKEVVTIRHLLTHTSGFAADFTDELTRALSVKERKKADQLLLIVDPGTAWHYGESTNVLGRVIEKKSGMSLPVYLKNVVFTPLGMNDTSFKVGDEHLDRLVTIHQRKEDGALTEVPNPAHDPGSTSGGGGIRSTAGDYCKFLRVFLQGDDSSRKSTLSHELIRQMMTNQIGSLIVETQPAVMPNLARPFPLGGGQDKFSFGFQITTSPTLAFRRGPGSLSWGGIFNTHFWIDPERQIAAVVMMQVLPYYDEKCMSILEGFESKLYAQLKESQLMVPSK